MKRRGRRKEEEEKEGEEEVEEKQGEEGEERVLRGRADRKKEGRPLLRSERCPQSDGFGSEAAREMAPES